MAARRPLLFGFACALVASASGCAPETVTVGGEAAALRERFVATPGRPVLLITIDTLRADALGSYGSSVATPVLDGLAARGVRFPDAVAHSVLTFPSHASMFTGDDPSRHGVHDNDRHRLPDSANTWAERLKAAGYETAGFVGAFPLDSVFGIAQGFDTYDDYYGSSASGIQLEERLAEDVVASAMTWLDGREGSWFAWVHVYDPHAPYTPPAPYDTLYPDAGYAGEVAYVDATLAPLLELAAERDAIVIATSDHGEALGERGEATHGVFAYQSTIQVPLIMAGLEGIDPGLVVNERVRHIDLLPTVLEAVGLEPGTMQGQSLNDVIAGATRPESVSYFEALHPYLDWGWAPLRGIHAGSLKYIELPLPELYDLDSPERETRNLVDTRNVDLARMAALLGDHMAAAPSQDTATEESAEALRRLRALGYAGNAAPTQRSAADFGPDDDPKRLIHIEGRVQEAVVAMDARDHRSAVTVLESVISERPSMARAYTLLARALEESVGPGPAAIALERGMEAGAVTPHLLNRLAFYYSLTGEFEKGIAAAEEVLRDQPDDVDTLAVLATIYARVGREPESEQLLLRVVELDPTFARPHGNLGTLYLQLGRQAEAAEAFQTALDFDPNLVEAHTGLGVMAANAESYEIAVMHWSQVLRQQPNAPFALYNLGIVLSQSLGRPADALPLIERYVQIRPNDQGARALLQDLRRQVQ